MLIFTKWTSIFLNLFGNMEKTGGWGQPNFACSRLTWLVQVTCLRHLSYTCCSLPHTTFHMCYVARGFLVPQPGMDPVPLSMLWKRGVLTTESPHPAAFYFRWKSHSPTRGFLPVLDVSFLGSSPSSSCPLYTVLPYGLHPHQDFLLLPAHPSQPPLLPPLSASFTFTSSLYKHYLNYIDYFRNSDNSRGMLKGNLFLF